MARGTGRRVSLRLPKELIRVWKAPQKGFFHIFSYLVTTRADARAQHGEQARGRGPMRAAHLPHRFFDDAPQCAAPPGMNCCHRPMFWICQEHGQAVGSSHRQEDAGLISQQDIAFRLSRAGISSRRAPGKAILKFAAPSVTNLINDRRMDLP